MSIDLLIIAMPTAAGYSAWRRFFNIGDELMALRPVTAEQQGFNGETLQFPNVAFPESVLTRQVDIRKQESGILFADNDVTQQLDSQVGQLIWFPDNKAVQHKERSINSTRYTFRLDQYQWPDSVATHFFVDRAASASKVRVNLDLKDDDRAKTTRCWLNPIVLSVSMLKDYDEADLSLLSMVLNKELFDYQIITCWALGEKPRGKARNALFEYIRDDAKNSRSLLRQLFYWGGEHCDVFEVLDRLGGQFNIQGFGSGQPRIEFCCQELPHVAQLLVDSCTDGGLCSLVATQRPSKQLIPRPSQGVYSLSSPYTPQALQSLISNIQGPQSKIVGKMMSELLALMTDAEVEELAGKFTSASNKLQAGLAELNQLCELLIAPRSPVHVEFPAGDCLAGRVRKCTYYQEFQTNWAFDPVRSPLQGAIGFVRRILGEESQTDCQTDGNILYNFGWWYAWRTALWNAPADLNLQILAEDDFRRIGIMKLRRGKLGAYASQPYTQPKHFVFANN